MIAAGTIEQRVLEIQERKEELIRGVNALTPSSCDGRAACTAGCLLTLFMLPCRLSRISRIAERQLSSSGRNMTRGEQMAST